MLGISAIQCESPLSEYTLWLTIYRGGLGLTGGLADIGSLVDCFYGIHDGKATTDILDKYDEVRRGIYHNIIDPVSSINLERLWKDPESIRETDPFFIMLRKAATDPKIAEQLQMVGSSVCSQSAADA
jgi:hypothetical protein